MPEKFRGRYRVSTSRARWWDYGNGSYFITICTRNRVHFFGEIVEGKFYPTEIGVIADTIWKKIPEKFKHVKLGAVIIMPNHMHGIINIHGSLHESSDLETKILVNPVVKTRFIASQNPESHENHSDNISKSKKGGITGIHNPMLHKNLSQMIRWYTGRVSYEAHKINPDFNWHRRFHDHIIRDVSEYRIKSRYIQQNPLNWKEDELY